MKFVDEEGVLERIDKNDPYYNDIESFVKDEHLINELVEGEIKSMKENREQIIFSCGNHVIHPVERRTVIPPVRGQRFHRGFRVRPATRDLAVGAL